MTTNTTQRFRIAYTTISDADRAAKVKAQVVALFYNQYRGEWFSAFTSATSGDGGGTGNGSGTLDLVITYKGKEYRIASYSHPTTMKACPEKNKATGAACIRQIYDTDGWTDPANWGITFPVSGTADDGTTLTFVKSVFNNKSNWSEYVKACIDYVNSMHEHQWEEIHTHEHEHNDYRGVDCLCEYSCPKTDCDFYCGMACDPAHLNGDAYNKELAAHNDCEGGKAGTCYRKCANPSCSLYNQFDSHCEVHNCVSTGEMPSNAGVYNGHCCACRTISENHTKREIDSKEEQDPNDPKRTIKVVTYKCSDNDGEPHDRYHYCGVEWVEKEEGHIHSFVLDDDGNEVCDVDVDDGNGGTKKCGTNRAHQYTEQIVEGGECMACGNDLATGMCGLNYKTVEACAKHSKCKPQAADTEDHYSVCGYTHRCDCTHIDEGHDRSKGEEWEEKQGEETVYYTEYTCGKCGHHWYEDGDGHEHAFTLVNDTETCLVKFTNRDGQEQTCNKTNQHHESDGTTCTYCAQPLTSGECPHLTHSNVSSLDEDGAVASKGHACEGYSSKYSDECVASAHAKTECDEAEEVVDPDDENKTYIQRKYICGESETSVGDRKKYCGFTWKEKSEGHTHAYQLQSDGTEKCLEPKKHLDGTQSICGVTRAHKYSIQVAGDCYKCGNKLKGGSLCGDDGDSPRKHGGHWTAFDDDAKDKAGNKLVGHHCDCEQEYEGHGKINIKEHDEVVTNGLDVITYTIQEYDCPEPEVGCGKHFCTTNSVTRKIQAIDHECNVAPNTGKTDGCAEYGKDKSGRDGNCKCKIHPAHQLEHEAKDDPNSECKVCKFCGNPMPAKAEYHGKPWHNLDTDTSGWTDMSESLGHCCNCYTYAEGHDIQTGPALKTVGGVLMNVTKYTCKKNCGFEWTADNTNDCPHAYYEIVNGEQGQLHEMWKDCVCTMCGATRSHALNGTVKNEGECAKKRCTNCNGYDWNYAQCSFTTNSTNAADGHIYGNYVDEKTHDCLCGGVTGQGHSLTNVATYTCEKWNYCVDSPNGCGHEIEHIHNYKAKSEKCGTKSRTVCTVCGREFNGPVGTSFDEIDYWGSASDNADRHEFPEDADGNKTDCFCYCGAVTNHIAATPQVKCGCICEEQDTPHYAGTNCYCVTHHILQSHQGPKQNSTDNYTTNVCDVCGNNWYAWDNVTKCGTCGEEISRSHLGSPHDCLGQEVTGTGTYYLTWEKYYTHDPEDTKHPHSRDVENPAGSSSGTCSGCGASGMDAWAAGSTLSFSGGYVTVDETGEYYLYSKIDDGGSVTIGPLTGGGGGHWTKWGVVGPATLMARAHYACSGNATSGEGPIAIAAVLVLKGATGPDGTIAGAPREE